MSIPSKNALFQQITLQSDEIDTLEEVEHDFLGDDLSGPAAVQDDAEGETSAQASASHHKSHAAFQLPMNRFPVESWFSSRWTSNIMVKVVEFCNFHARHMILLVDVLASSTSMSSHLSTQL